MSQFWQSARTHSEPYNPQFWLKFRDILLQFVEHELTQLINALKYLESNLSVRLFPAQQPNASQGRLILEVPGSHTMTHHSR